MSGVSNIISVGCDGLEGGRDAKWGRMGRKMDGM